MVCDKTQDANLENRETCKRIAEKLEAYYTGAVYECPYCANKTYEPTEPCQCGDMDCAEEWQKADWLDAVEIFDIEYRITGDLQYSSVELMIAGGGPSIYIDTQSHSVELYWAGERASYPISYELSDAIDEMFGLRYESKLSLRY